MAAMAANLGLGSLLPLSVPRYFNPMTREISIATGRRICPRLFTVFKCQVAGIDKEAAVDKESQSAEFPQPSKNWKIKMLYDGECPLCMREVNMLKERNKLYGTIKFVDISSKEYSAEENEGLDYKTAMGRIHAILDDGTVLRDIAAFRGLYEEVGLGWVYAMTKYEPVATIAGAIYDVWAKYRLQVAGRPSLETILEARKENMVKLCNEDKNCAR
ncbi:uncharacterized protein At5g50100, mitochondrial isoform X1 [Amborella trichopoda]|uniref:uncharacterized protein At5g50100, mitochondrial isoform X1 n=1 Tax=Amborella trichopoda TaxID=13333 RepID=UPI0005D3C59A|nr:uncharacterized protein At5g50100, mitochondrial isoform X1 [Amborella trichopoda]|eukprot:XP_011620915.1 uncharacterized protein At5g50100, mitochondrial isoform X1 [Amborella trichopoda]